MLIRFIRSTPVDGRDYHSGDEVEVSPALARSLVEGYAAAVYVKEPPPRRVGMVVNQDPEVAHRDPVPAPAPKRRRGG